MRSWSFAILKVFWGTYLLLTSIYCLVAFLPYTYFALIKAPPYAWMPWFAHHQAVLYWIALLAIAVTQAPWRRTKRGTPVFWLFAVLALPGIYLSIRPFLPSIQSNWAAYGWSLASLAPLALVAGLDVARNWPAERPETSEGARFTYSNGVLLAVLVALVYGIGSAAHNYSETKSLSFDWAKLELTSWSVISHTLIAIIVISVLNLTFMASRRTRWPKSFQLALIGLLVFVGLWIALVGFLNSALSFEGWAAHAYAASLAASLTLFLGSLVLPVIAARREEDARRRSRLIILWTTAIALSIFATALPTLIAGGDWNGALQHAFTLFFWIVLGVCVYALRPARRSYSAASILAVLLLAGFTYKALQATAIFWGKPLGSTDDEIARSLETYAADNVSFQMAHHILGNERSVPCGDLCRIMREYTNIRDAEARTDVNLVDPMQPAQGERPNIFILVLDSVRPDYLGPYNPKVDFTPNLDAFGRDSVVVHNAYTQYAGTTLSEPAIWSGAMLLHAHYMQPFSRVNSLEKLANTDGYQMILSYDSVLSQILSSNDRITKLDADKPWNQVELCSTLQQTENALDARSDKTQPVLFYTQAMNVHQFARNDLPRLTRENWAVRPGFNTRIAYELHELDTCLGSFFTYLKSRNLYNNSVIVIASDHGDATGEFGRYSHSINIYPEVMRVPLIVHLPEGMRQKLVYDDTHISALTDITPSLYYLLGHRPVRSNPIFGHPIFVATPDELKTYRRYQLFLASDERAVYGLLTENGRFLYTTYDSPSQSFLYDLSKDPNAQHSLLTDSLKQQYDEQIIDQLHTVADFYGYKPGVGSLLAAAH